MDIKRISVLEHLPYQPNVLGYVDALPATNSVGDRYILSTTQNINTWYDDAWIEDTPEEGWRCTVLNNGEPFDLKFTAGEWVIVEDVYDSEELQTEKLPTEEIPTEEFEQVQSDWEEADTLSPAYILNKPTIPSTGDFGVMSVTGDGVDNTDPANPVISYPNLSPYLTEVNWGDIGGDLEDQPDLVNALAAKEDVISEGVINEYFSWDKTWRQIDYSHIANTPDLTSLGYWVPWDFGIRSDNGTISIMDGGGSNEMVIGYDYHGGDYALTVVDDLNGKLIAGYDGISGDYRYGGHFGVPYITIKEGKLIVNTIGDNDGQLRAWFFSNPNFADNLVGTPGTSYISILDDGYVEYYATNHYFGTTSIYQGTLEVDSNVSVSLGTRPNAVFATVLGESAAGIVVNRTLAEFASDLGTFGATTFLELTDTPSSYAGAAEYIVVVNDGLTGVEFVQKLSFAQIIDVTAKRLLGRYSITDGETQEITIGTGLSLSDAGVLTSTGGTGSSTFLGLTDTPSTYTGKEEYFVMVNDSANGLYFEQYLWPSRIGTLTSKRLLGRYATTDGVGQQITLGANLTLSDEGVLSASGGSGTGDVTGGSSSIDNAIARYDGTTGKVIQNSGIIIDDSNNLLPNTSNGSKLGSPTKMFSDLYIASGGVIDWNNGNSKITHSSGKLTITGILQAAAHSSTIANPEVVNVCYGTTTPPATAPEGTLFIQYIA